MLPNIWILMCGHKKKRSCFALNGLWVHIQQQQCVVYSVLEVKHRFPFSVLFRRQIFSSSQSSLPCCTTFTSWKIKNKALRVSWENFLPEDASTGENTLFWNAIFVCFLQSFDKSPTQKCPSQTDIVTAFVLKYRCQCCHHAAGWVRLIKPLKICLRNFTCAAYAWCPGVTPQFLTDRWVCVGRWHDSLWSQNDTAMITCCNYGIRL